MKRVFLSFLHEDIWEVNQFRAVIGNEYVGAMAYDESLKKTPERSPQEVQRNYLQYRELVDHLISRSTSSLFNTQRS